MDGRGGASGGDRAGEVAGVVGVVVFRSFRILNLQKITKSTKFTRVQTTSYTGLQDLLVTKSLGDRSRVHMHGDEPREIALQHQWRKATREKPPKPRKFGSTTEWRHH